MTKPGNPRAELESAPEAELEAPSSEEALEPDLPADAELREPDPATALTVPPDARTGTDAAP